MPAVTVKGSSGKAAPQLKARALRHHRSLNSEIIALLEAVTAPQRVDPETLLARAASLRRRVAGRLTDSDWRHPQRGTPMIVVDTNVIAYLWLPGKRTPAAERLSGRIPTGTRRFSGAPSSATCSPAACAVETRAGDGAPDRE